MCIFVSPSLAAVCDRTLSDSEAAPSSETQRAQASVSDASLIRVEALISASPQWTASLSGPPWQCNPYAILHLNWQMWLYICSLVSIVLSI